MKFLLLVFVSFLTALAIPGCSADSPLARAEANCNKYPSPDARAACYQQAKETEAAFKAYREDEAARAKAAQAAQDGDAAKPKKDNLCFKRAATGEMLCPN